MATLNSLENAYNALKTDYSGLEARIKALEDKFAIYVTSSDLQTEVTQLDESITDVNSTINVIETKLQKVTLPDDTRYYLAESEITDFRNHFRQLRAFMAEIERTRQALIRMSARYNLTNSSL